MAMTRKHRLWAAWFSMWLLVLGACLPTLAQAAARHSEAGWVEVCTSTGMVKVQVNAPLDPAPAGEPSLGSSVWCDWCQVHGAGWALPPSPPSVRLPVLRTTEWPAEFYRSATVSRVWTPLQSRAPPL